jgi:hypothetical protein
MICGDYKFQPENETKTNKQKKQDETFDGRTLSAYCVLRCGEETHVTHVRVRRVNPTWNQVGFFFIFGGHR